MHRESSEDGLELFAGAVLYPVLHGRTETVTDRSLQHEPSSGELRHGLDMKRL